MSPHCLRTWRCASTGGAFSPGWYVCVLVRVQLSAEEWEVPGLVAMVNYGRKKQCEVRDEVFHGPPNFVLDVFDDAADENYLRRRDRFSRYGVHEYVAILNDDPKALAWHRLDAGGYRSVEPDDDGIFRSEALPNFGVPLNALRDRDWWTVLGSIERGVSRRELQLNQGCRLYPAAAAFPIIAQGRRPHWTFRGLHNVHLRYGLSARRVAKATRLSQRLRRFRFLPVSLRKLPPGATQMSGGNCTH